MRCGLLAGTAEGSIIFTRVRKCSHLTRCSLRLPLNCISIGSAVFGQHTRNTDGSVVFARMRQYAPQPVSNTWFFRRIHTSVLNIIWFGPVGLRESMCVIVPNFVKIGGIAAAMWRVDGVQDGGRPPILTVDRLNRSKGSIYALSYQTYWRSVVSLLI